MTTLVRTHFGPFQVGVRGFCNGQGRLRRSKFPVRLLTPCLFRCPGSPATVNAMVSMASLRMGIGRVAPTYHKSEPSILKLLRPTQRSLGTPTRPSRTLIVPDRPPQVPKSPLLVWVGPPCLAVNHPINSKSALYSLYHPFAVSPAYLRLFGSSTLYPQGPKRPHKHKDPTKHSL